MKGICRLCLEYKDLCDAHIIPGSFYAPDTRLIGLDDPYIRKSPVGLYDPNILCISCDQDIGARFDHPAKQILIDRQELIQEVRYGHSLYEKATFYRLSNQNMYETISNFFISVLWRASISKRIEVAKTNLGVYEDRARQVILGNASGANMGFTVALCCFSDVKAPMQLMPTVKQKIDGVNFYTFIAGSIKTFIKVDKLSAPKQIAHLMLSPKSSILMIESKIKNVPEREILLKMANRLADYSSRRKSVVV